MFEPWIGSDYSETRLLILGESSYSWFDDDGLRDPTKQHSSVLVRECIDNFPTMGNFFKCIARALANEYDPDKPRLEFVWNRVAFTNYVSGSVGNGPRIRPTEQMWVNANQRFLSDLTKYFKLIPNRILVLGRDMWSRMPDADIVVTDDVQAYRVREQLVMCSALSHPSRGLSWQQLAANIQFTYFREFRI